MFIAIELEPRSLRDVHISGGLFRMGVGVVFVFGYFILVAVLRKPNATRSQTNPFRFYDAIAFVAIGFMGAICTLKFWSDYRELIQRRSDIRIAVVELLSKDVGRDFRREIADLGYSLVSRELDADVVIEIGAEARVYDKRTKRDIFEGFPVKMNLLRSDLGVYASNETAITQTQLGGLNIPKEPFPSSAYLSIEGGVTRKEMAELLQNAKWNIAAYESDADLVIAIKQTTKEVPGSQFMNLGTSGGPSYQNALLVDSSLNISPPEKDSTPILTVVFPTIQNDTSLKNESPEVNLMRKWRTYWDEQKYADKISTALSSFTHRERF